MKNLLLIIVTLVFSLNSFSQDENSSVNVNVVLENHTLKYDGKLDGKIMRFDMKIKFNGHEKIFESRNDGGNLTDEMIKSVNNLHKYYNEGDTTEVVFHNILVNTEKGVKIGKPLVVEYIF